MIGHALQPVLAPIGFNWQMTVALIPGFAAREVAVAALGTVYAIEGGKEAAGASATLASTLVARHRAVVPGLVRLRAAVRLDAGRRQARDRRLAMDVVTFGYMPGLAYIAAFATYHVAVALGAG